MVTSSTTATLAAKSAATSVPIVILNVPHPLGEGLVASLAHPDGNVTGLSQAASAEIAGKRLQLLKDAVPNIGRVAVFISPDTARAEAGFLEFAAQSLHI